MYLLLRYGQPTILATFEPLWCGLAGKWSKARELGRLSSMCRGRQIQSAQSASWLLVGWSLRGVCCSGTVRLFWAPSVLTPVQGRYSTSVRNRCDGSVPAPEPVRSWPWPKPKSKGSRSTTGIEPLARRNRSLAIRRRFWIYGFCSVTKLPMWHCIYENWLEAIIRCSSPPSKCAFVSQQPRVLNERISVVSRWPFLNGLFDRVDNWGTVWSILGNSRFWRKCKSWLLVEWRGGVPKFSEEHIVTAHCWSWM